MSGFEMKAKPNERLPNKR